jgi:3-deoxy-D-manno-octulosonic acid kinase
MNDSAGHEVDVARVASADGAILFDRRRVAQVDAARLDPAHWPDAARPQGQGGRGAVWFVRGEFGEGVLRHYRRGGLIGRLVSDRYVWRGEDATRSFREFRLLAALRALALPVPSPLAAGYAREGAFYRADLLTQRIPSARTLAQRLHDGSLRVEDWRRIGGALARFHAHGAYHADLNAHNVLFDGEDAIWLLDFDRGELRRAEPGWIESNLARLQRSLRKLGAESLPGWNASWAALREAHVATDPRARSAA